MFRLFWPTYSASESNWDLFEAQAFVSALAVNFGTAFMLACGRPCTLAPSPFGGFARGTAPNSFYRLISHGHSFQPSLFPTTGRSPWVSGGFLEASLEYWLPFTEAFWELPAVSLRECTSGILSDFQAICVAVRASML